MWLVAASSAPVGAAKAVFARPSDRLSLERLSTCSPQLLRLWPELEQNKDSSKRVENLSSAWRAVAQEELQTGAQVTTGTETQAIRRITSTLLAKITLRCEDPIEAITILKLYS